MNRVRSRLRDLRISNKLLFPVAAAMAVVVVAASLVAGHLISGNIERGVSDRLVDARHNAALSIEAWEQETQAAVEHLADHAADLSAADGEDEIQAVISSEAHRQSLDYAVVSLPDGDTLTVGEHAPPSDDSSTARSLATQPSTLGNGNTTSVERLALTDAGWALESKRAAEIPGLGIVEITGGRLLATNLLDRLHQALGESSEVALTIDSQVVAASGEGLQVAICNNCHQTSDISASDAMGNASPAWVDMGGASYLMLHGPLVVGGSVVGAFTVDVPADAIISAQNRARWGVFGAGFAVFAVVVGVQGLVSRSISRPITRLAEASRDIAAGNLERRLDAGGRDEIGVLSESVASLTRSLAGQIEELSLLQEASLAANSSLELDDVLQSIMDSATEVLRADAGSIMLLDRTCSKLEVKAAKGGRADAMTETSVSVASGPAGWVVRNRRPLLLPDDLADPDMDLVLNRPDISSSVIVPIETRDITLGVLNLNIYGSGRRFDRRTLTFAQTLANHSGMAIDKARHHQEVNDLYNGLIRALASAIDAKDPYTFGHSEMVHRYAVIMGVYMGLDEFLLKGLETAAYLHDIGKIGVKDAVLSKPSRLTPDERRAVETHPIIGAQILDGIVFPWPVVDAVRHHHERWDGSGYPARLARADIPLHARVLAVADSFDAMTSDRPYRLGLSFDEAVAEVLRCNGSQFDPGVVDAFLAIQSEIGSTLESSRATRISAA